MATATDGTGMTPAEIHDTLRNERRRAVIECLRAEGRTDLRTLSERVAAREAAESPPPRGLRESVYNSLHQTHLPKLHDRDVLTYDRDRKTVELNGSAGPLDAHLDAVTRYGVTWALFYRTLGTVALLTVVASGAGVPLFEAVPITALATVFLCCFAAATAYQLWSRRMYYLQSILPESGR